MFDLLVGWLRHIQHERAEQEGALHLAFHGVREAPNRHPNRHVIHEAPPLFVPEAFLGASQGGQHQVFILGAFQESRDDVVAGRDDVVCDQVRRLRHHVHTRLVFARVAEHVRKALGGRDAARRVVPASALILDEDLVGFLVKDLQDRFAGIGLMHAARHHICV